MYFTFNSFVSLATLLMLVNAAQGCSIAGGFCGPVTGSALCCAGLTCTTTGVCRGCAIAGGFCGAITGGVPCCAGLTCTTTSVCR
ncbi:hypothetical protein C8J57DRAFT_1363489 [Mycena rebaudengoi]|nr:hypothetical protein C8J57DRAFT_1363489 [Mycena rebaudengoi]